MDMTPWALSVDTYRDFALGDPPDSRNNAPVRHGQLNCTAVDREHDFAGGDPPDSRSKALQAAQ
jgi:hypothetical protein